jgi:hypothetical protein
VRILLRPAGEAFYHPVPRGLEIQIGEKLAELRRRNAGAAAGGPKKDPH